MNKPTEFEVGKIELPEPPQVTLPDECYILTTEGKIKWLIYNLEKVCSKFIKANKECKEELLFIKNRIEQLKNELQNKKDL